MTTVLGQDAAVEGDHQRDSLACALFQVHTVRGCVEMKGLLYLFDRCDPARQRDFTQPVAETCGSGDNRIFFRIGIIRLGGSRTMKPGLSPVDPGICTEDWSSFFMEYFLP